MDLLIIAVVGLLAIAGATQISDRVRVAPALLLLAGGIVVGFLPVVPAIEVEPEIILEGILPPLLYATAVGISTINFRRELASVVVLAILLVIVSAAVIGGVLTLVIPGLSPAWAIAVGAVLSPTDAVAISIARRLGVSQRIITVLEGEGLLNDATALVVLSSASTAATAGAVTVSGVVEGFAASVLVALAVGWAVGELTLHLRARITDASVDTVVSFTIPFLAAIPAEHMGGSGLVAAVIAGLVTGHRGPRVLPPTTGSPGRRPGTPLNSSWRVSSSSSWACNSSASSRRSWPRAPASPRPSGWPSSPEDSRCWSGPPSWPPCWRGCVAATNATPPAGRR